MEAAVSGVLASVDWGLAGQLILAVLLAGVGGLVLLFWQEVRKLRMESRQAPLLAEQLAGQLLAAREGLGKLYTHLKEVAPELGRLMQDASQRQVELKFLLERAQQAAVKLEQASAAVGAAQAPLPVAPVPEPTKIGRSVAAANGAAANSAGRDPIEELLARMAREDAAEAAGPTGKPNGKRARGITQAELDLQAKALGR